METAKEKGSESEERGPCLYDGHYRRGLIVDGMIMNQFQRFVVSRFGREAWPALTKRADVPLGNELLPMGQTYPDSHLFGLVPVASEVTGIPVAILLEEFGVFLAPSLLRIYQPLIPSQWKTLDLVENTEAVIHRVVRQRNPEAAPPELRVPDEAARPRW